MSIYVELGFPENAAIDVPYWKETVLRDLKKAGVIQDHRLIAENHLIMDPAYVHIREDSTREKEAIQLALKEQQAYTIGRYGDWTYCSIEDCISQAQQLIAQIRGGS